MQTKIDIETSKQIEKQDSSASNPSSDHSNSHGEKVLICVNTGKQFSIGKGPFCYLEDKTYLYSSNNQLEADPLEQQLAAEYAVFSGNIMKTILGESQPDLHLAILEKKSRTKFYRVSHLLEEYENWEDVVRVGDNELFFNWRNGGEVNIQQLTIHNLTAIVVVCHFLGEIDWATSNFGFVKTHEQEYTAVRLDPGFSFHPTIFECVYSDLPNRLKNLLISYVSKEINEAFAEPTNYLGDVIDHNSQRVKNVVAEKLFTNQKELFETLGKIASIPPNEWQRLARQSFSPEHKDEAKKLLSKLTQRQALYANALNNLLGEAQEELAASLLPKHSNSPKAEASGQIGDLTPVITTVSSPATLFANKQGVKRKASCLSPTGTKDKSKDNQQADIKINFSH